jgi:hypothetical protein
MKEYTLKWPDNFNDYSWEIEYKGWFEGLEIVVDGKTLRPAFYDPVRLSQEIAGEISSAGFFCEPFLIIIQRVTRETIESVVADLAKSGELERLVKRI